jgi:hypothetical protein
MCGLCGMFGVAEHWTETSGAEVSKAGAAAPLRRAERQHQVRLANALLAPFGLRCADWQGRFTVTGRTGKSMVVDHLGALWPAAEKLAGRPIDPLDPLVIARAEALAGEA